MLHHLSLLPLKVASIPRLRTRVICAKGQVGRTDSDFDFQIHTLLRDAFFTWCHVNAAIVGE